MKRPKQNPLQAQTKKILHLTFRSQKLLESSLIHPSYRNENPSPGLFDFDRLEFFGDSILNYVVCRKLYALFPQANEGVLSRLRSILVSRKILARVARDLRFSRLLQVGKSLRSLPIAAKSKIMADGFESFLAALYLDKGFQPAEKFILKHFDSYFDAKRLLRLDPNPKSTLQELSQKEWQRLPIYTSEVTSAGVKSTVAIGKTRKAHAVGRNRQESEEKAARLLIQKIRQEFVRRAKKVSSGKKSRKIF